MIEVVPTEEGLRAVDARKNSIEVVTEDWVSGTVEGDVPSPTDVHVAGTTTALRLPPAFVLVTCLEDGSTAELGSETGPLELGDAEYLVHVNGNVNSYVRFSGSAEVAKPNYDATVLSFPRPTDVTLGFRSRVQSPQGTVTVPRTPDGVATALTYLSASNRTTTPDRSFPTMRGHPPLVAFDEETDVPAHLEATGSSPDTELILPPDLDYLFPAASLSQYLGSAVTVEDGATPRLRTPGDEHELGDLPEFERSAAALLRRTFLLDCLVRNAGPYGTNLAQSGHLDTLSLDADSLYGSSIGERVGAYLDAPFEAVTDDLPEWHLSMYVEPTYHHVETLPYLLGDLPNVFLPRSDPLEEEERLSRSLDDFYRSGGDAVTVDLVKPRLGPGRVHGWLADGAPIDVFKSVPAAYRNGASYDWRVDEPISIVAVLNDSEMSNEHGEAARIYRERATELDLDITVHERLSTADLARTFESSHDLVHYIGHCEETGLRCPDGTLSLSSLCESRTQTFFLNACGSFNEGLTLVDKGSVAGAVTFNKVLDADAARVGTSFARLLMHGFCLERALDLARRRIMMGKDYTVVGDGTHVLTQSDNFIPATARLESDGEDRYYLSYEVFSATKFGGYFQPHVASNRQSHLHGSPVEFTLDRSELRRFLEQADAPVVYEGDLYWSESLARQLDAE